MNVPNRLVALATACLGLAALLVVATLPRPVIGQNWPAWREQWVQVLDAAFFAACLLLTVGLLHTRRAAQRAGREPSAGGRQPDVYAMLVESTPMPMLCLDASLRCVVVNEAFAGLLRKGQASLVGQSAGDCLTPAMRDALLPDMEAALAGEIRRRVLEIATESGQDDARGQAMRYFDAQISRLPRDGTVQGVLVSLRDITVQTLAEEAMARRESEFKLIFDSVPDCVKVMGLDGRIARINPAGLAMIEADDLRHGLQTCIADLVVAEDRAVYLDFCRRVLSGEPMKLRYRGIGLKGTPRWVETQAVPMREKDGRVVGALAITRDITRDNETAERLQAALVEVQACQAREQQLDAQIRALAKRADTADQASLAKTSFLANMSHEIRTPLNGIIGMVHRLQQGSLSEKQAAQLDKLETAGQHLLHVINNILDLSKIESGKLELEQIEFHPDELLSSVAALVEAPAREKALYLTVEAEPVAHLLLGDPTRLRQALLNLANNAIKFTEQGGVTLRLRLADDGPDDVLLRFEAEDSGIGIAPEASARLVEEFAQARSDTARCYGGSGLGLAMTRRLAQRMGGNAGFESEEGVGSLFWFTARLKKSDSASACGYPDSDFPLDRMVCDDLRGSRILLVEDDPICREIGFELLEGAGFAAELASDGAAALDMASANPPALILMDMQMPVMDGAEATRQLRKHPALAKTPIIALTASVFAEDRDHCLASGMNDFLSKPVDPLQMVTTIVHWLRQESVAEGCAAS